MKLLDVSMLPVREPPPIAAQANVQCDIQQQLKLLSVRESSSIGTESYLNCVVV